MSLTDLPVAWLFGIILMLTLLSAYFSSSETAMVALNRYRLRHLVKSKHAGARKANRLLQRPDRLLGVILIGNNLVNFFAASVATILGLRLFGDSGVVIAPVALTIFFLVFAEVGPKTIAAQNPEPIAFRSAYILQPLLKLLYPGVWFINGMSNFIVKPFLAKTEESAADGLTFDELRTVVTDGLRMRGRRQNMMLGILDLEKVTVNDIMVPRSEMLGVDIDDDIEDILAHLANSQHTRLPIYKDHYKSILGILHLRRLARYVSTESITKAELLELSDEPYYVPEATPLHTQLFNFQKEKRRIALVVDEYGDVEGIVTLEDILEEIVGEFTTDFATHMNHIETLGNGEYIIDGSALLRDMNRALDWSLPTDGPKTLNGLVLEHLETIPENNLCLQIGDYRLETTQLGDNLVKRVKLALNKTPATHSDDEDSLADTPASV